jgi:hypothetical protein
MTNPTTGSALQHLLSAAVDFVTGLSTPPADFHSSIWASGRHVALLPAFVAHQLRTIDLHMALLIAVFARSIFLPRFRAIFDEMAGLLGVVALHIFGSIRAQGFHMACLAGFVADKIPSFGTFGTSEGKVIRGLTDSTDDVLYTFVANVVYFAATIAPGG